MRNSRRSSLPPPPHHIAVWQSQHRAFPAITPPSPGYETPCPLTLRSPGSPEVTSPPSGSHPRTLPSAMSCNSSAFELCSPGRVPRRLPGQHDPARPRQPVNEDHQIITGTPARLASSRRLQESGSTASGTGQWGRASWAEACACSRRQLVNGDRSYATLHEPRAPDAGIGAVDFCGRLAVMMPTACC